MSTQNTSNEKPNCLLGNKINNFRPITIINSNSKKLEIQPNTRLSNILTMLLIYIVYCLLIGQFLVITKNSCANAINLKLTLNPFLWFSRQQMQATRQTMLTSSMATPSTAPGTSPPSRASTTTDTVRTGTVSKSSAHKETTL